VDKSAGPCCTRTNNRLFTATVNNAIAPFTFRFPDLFITQPPPPRTYALTFAQQQHIGVHNMPSGETRVSSPLSIPLTASTNHSITTPVNTDLSRSRLSQTARWIRDELDLCVAREGPDILRPDDVLTLHETFIALRHAHNITISDLRATGIHKAIQDISGVATRWPGRLCDDCDKIIEIWTAKFGPFSEIHPFLYGRGGRLEGIASIHEYSREVDSPAYSYFVSPN
jgi:hypothetical protein